MSSKTPDTELWIRVENYNFDLPLCEYGLATRLAKENCWTIAFTGKAISEYKKFMYLAAISDQMVAPSPVIDIVWHEHIIFTQSYADFCMMIGKNIQHIPSVNSTRQTQSLIQSRKYTESFYTEHFGDLPSDIWKQPDMLADLGLKQFKFKLKSVSLVIILSALTLLVPIYHLLRPVYLRINNPGFLINYWLLALCVVGLLEIYNRTVLKKLLTSIVSRSLIQNLKPEEVIYMQTGQLANVISFSLDKLIKKQKLSIDENKLKIKNSETGDSVEEFTILETLRSSDKISYQLLLTQLANKPCFTNIASSMDALKKYIHKSAIFGRLFCINAVSFTTLITIAFMRYLTGISQNKPVVLIFLSTLIAGILAIFFLYRLGKDLFESALPDLTRREILARRESDSVHNDWIYLLSGAAAVDASLLVLMEGPKGKRQPFDSDSRSSCFSGDSSGGDSHCSSGGDSSCSSCGGCGSSD